MNRADERTLAWSLADAAKPLLNRDRRFWTVPSGLTSESC